jgi:hypothetical protein
MKQVLGVCDQCKVATVYPYASKEEVPKRGSGIAICVQKETCYGQVLVVGVLKLEAEAP